MSNEFKVKHGLIVNGDSNTKSISKQIYNDSGALLTQFKIVKITGLNVSVNIPTIDVVTSSTNDQLIGILDFAVNNNSIGKVLSYGTLECTGFNTTSSTVNSKVYCDDSGDLTLSETNCIVGQVLTLNVNGVILFDFNSFKTSATGDSFTSPSNILLVDPDSDEVIGERYQTWSNADSYLSNDGTITSSSSGVVTIPDDGNEDGHWIGGTIYITSGGNSGNSFPITDSTSITITSAAFPDGEATNNYRTQKSSSSNIWGIKITGNNSENIILRSQINIIGQDEITNLTGSFTSLASGYIDGIVYNCRFTNFATSNPTTVYAFNCIFSGGTPTGMILARKCKFFGGDYSGVGFFQIISSEVYMGTFNQCTIVNSMVADWMGPLTFNNLEAQGSYVGLSSGNASISNGANVTLENCKLELPDNDWTFDGGEHNLINTSISISDNDRTIEYTNSAIVNYSFVAPDVIDNEFILYIDAGCTLSYYNIDGLISITQNATATVTERNQSGVSGSINPNIWTDNCNVPTGYDILNIQAIGYGNNMFVGVINSPVTDYDTLYSQDGTSWLVGTTGLSFVGVKTIAYGASTFVMVTDSFSDANQIAYSDDGILWTEFTIPPPISGFRGFDIAYGNNTFVIVGQDGFLDYNIIYSTDKGRTWTRVATAGDQITAVAFNGELFVAADEDGNTFTSSDGITWTTHSGAITSNDWCGMEYGNGVFVIITDNSVSQIVGYSSDGQTWAYTSVGLAITHIAYGNGKFIITENGGSNNSLTSVDGITWTTILDPPSTYIGCIAYGNGRFVAGSTPVITLGFPIRNTRDYESDNLFYNESSGASTIPNGVDGGELMFWNDSLSNWQITDINEDVSWDETNKRFNIRNIKLNPIISCSALTATVGAAGILTGSYVYKVSYEDENGNYTEAGIMSTSVTVTTQQIQLTNIPISTDSRVVARIIWRTVADSGWPYVTYYLTRISDNTTSVFTDNIADSSLGTSPKYYNNTGGNIYWSNNSFIRNASMALSIGVNAGNNNAGYETLFIGQNSGFTNTTGAGNLFIGHYAGYNNVSGHNNIFVGSNAGRNNLTANGNTCIGKNSGYNNETGVDNLFIGYSAGYNTDANYNTMLGANAGYNTTTGASNSFFGRRAGYTNIDGYSNIFFGSSTGYYNTSGNQNVFIGNSAGEQNTIGYLNTYIGVQAGQDGTDVLYNLAIGHRALEGNVGTGNNANCALGYYAANSAVGIGMTVIGYRAGERNTGTNITCIGSESGEYLTTGNRCTFIGYGAGQGNISIAVTGDDNTCIGVFSGQDLTTGHTNVFIGVHSGLELLTGNNNSFIGAFSGENATNVNNSVFIGTQSGLNALVNNGCIFIGYQSGMNETTNNKLYISNSNTSTPLIYGEFDIGSELLIFNGNVGVKTTTNPIHELQINGTVAPETSGQDLGTSSLRWDANLDNVDVNEMTINDVLVAPNSATAPSSPSSGQIYFDSATNKLRCFDGTIWNDMF